MYDLTSSATLLQENFKKSVSHYVVKNGVSPKTVLVHTHPNYGDVHLYLSEKSDAEPFDDLIGCMPVESILNDDELERVSHGDVEISILGLLNGTPKNNSEFNVCFAQYCSIVMASAMRQLSENEIPDRIMILAESGEVAIEWYPSQKE